MIDRITDRSLFDACVKRVAKHLGMSTHMLLIEVGLQCRTGQGLGPSLRIVRNRHLNQLQLWGSA